jgi:hypothetical protein
MFVFARVVAPCLAVDRRGERISAASYLHKKEAEKRISSSLKHTSYALIDGQLGRNM